MIFGTFFFLLSVLAMLPVVIVILGKFEGSPWQRFEAFVSHYDGTLIGLGTIILVSLLAFLTNRASNNSAAQIANSNRHTQAEIQIAIFRQNWINEIASDLSKIAGFLAEKYRGDKAITSAEDFHQLQFSVLIRLNTKNPAADKIRRLLLEAIAAMDENDKKKHAEVLDKFPEAINEFLKKEWEELKGKLEIARQSETFAT